MGRRKIEIKKLENLRTRNATFKKRRQGILKKARELAVLTDSKVTLSIKNGAALENHVFNDHLDPLTADATTATQSTSVGTIVDAAGTSPLDDRVLRLDDIESVPVPLQQTVEWPYDTMESGYAQSIDSILDPLALSVANDFCGYSLDFNTSTSSLGIVNSPVLQSSSIDPFQNIENYDDCNWLLPLLDWNPEDKNLLMS